MTANLFLCQNNVDTTLETRRQRARDAAWQRRLHVMTHQAAAAATAAPSLIFTVLTIQPDPASAALHRTHTDSRTFPHAGSCQQTIRTWVTLRWLMSAYTIFSWDARANTTKRCCKVDGGAPNSTNHSKLYDCRVLYKLWIKHPVHWSCSSKKRVLLTSVRRLCAHRTMSAPRSRTVVNCKTAILSDRRSRVICHRHTAIP